MSTTATPSKVPSAIAPVYDELRSEITWLHGRWLTYRELFAESPRRIELLNEVAGTFFYIIQEVLLDEVQVCLSKLTDPATSGKHENLSLEQLQAKLEGHGDSVLATKCRAHSRHDSYSMSGLSGKAAQGIGAPRPANGAQATSESAAGRVSADDRGCAAIRARLHERDRDALQRQ